MGAHLLGLTTELRSKSKLLAISTFLLGIFVGRQSNALVQIAGQYGQYNYDSSFGQSQNPQENTTVPLSQQLGHPKGKGNSTSSGYQSLLREAQYMLNDKAIRLSPYVERPWLYFDSNSDLFSSASENNAKRDMPKQKLILTDIGWNHPSKMHGLKDFSRSLRSRELLQAFVDHPHFDPTVRFTDDIIMNLNATFDPNVQYIVLLDIETCFESNYPKSTGKWEDNVDTQGGRLVLAKNRNDCYSMMQPTCHPHISLVLQSALFRQHPNNTSLMYWECGGGGISKQYREFNPSPNLFVFSYSSAATQLVTASDMGSPPPANKPVTLSFQQRQDIQICDESERPYLFTFKGSMARSQARRDLRGIHNGQDVLVKGTMDQMNETYPAMLYKSLFSGAPRGDNLFSYRFTEVLSAGAIPVVYADQWVLPFHPKLVDWSQCVVTIAEAQASLTVGILEQISPVDRCRMRQHCYEIYSKYMVNPEANIAGMVESIGIAQQ